jgi:hypothetical protein
MIGREVTRGTMDEAPGRVAPADREWGWCRRVNGPLRNLLERKGLWMGECDHVVVLKLDQRNVILVYWLGDRSLGYLNAVASVGRDIARLGAPESV